MNVFLVLLLVGVTLVSAGLPGGWSDQPVNHPDAMDMAWEAIDEVNAQTNGMYSVVPIKILKYKTQVVAGVNHKVEFVAAETACRKPNGDQEFDLEALQECSVNDQSPIKHKCEVTVWTQSWNEDFTPQVTVNSCVNYNPNLTGSSEDSSSEEDGVQQNIIARVPLFPMKKNRFESPDMGNFDHWDKFAEFLKKYNKTGYPGGTEELFQRFNNFKSNLKVIEALNSKEAGSATYGVTKFADMSTDEFAEVVLTPKWVDNGYPERTADVGDLNPDIPVNWDWREHGAVTPVKNQGMCGSCWAFSVTGNIEGQWKIKKNKLVSLSEQELVDCDKLDQGCDGGLPSNAYKEIERIGGLETESDYPYEGSDDKCSVVKKEIGVYINSSVKIPSDEAKMAIWLKHNGPISIGINAFAMQFYWGGISHPWKIFCNPDNIDHGVLIVGYGVKGAKPYWIVKNSWGSDWGEDGYYYVYRGKGVCGLNTMATSSIVN